MFLFVLARPIASSLSGTSPNETTPFDPITGECIDVNRCRTTAEIIWSCLSVIFICTWVAIHPNIPIVQDRKTNRWHSAALLYEKVEFMVVALLVPEFMILWAMRQREKAKEIRERFKKYGWSMTHGFFVIMGGFSLYDGDKFCGYLWDRDRGWDEYRRPYDGQAERYLEEIRLHYENYQSFCLGQLKQKDQDNLSTRPQSNEHHVDPTKSTQEKKTLPGSPEASTLLEFLIAKGYINLNEDEIKDKSHADFIAKFIAVVQTAWFILQVIARAVEGFAITELEIITVAFAIINFGTYFLWWNKPLQVNYPVKVYWRHQEAKIGRTQEDVPLSGAVSAAAGDKDPYVVVSWMLRLIFLPVRILWRIFWLCYKILLDEDDSNRAISISSRFDKESPVYLYIVVYGIAAGFGAIHCIPWVFQFPTHTEQLLWRISAVAVAVAPIAGGVSHGYMAHTPNTFLDWKDLAMFAVIMILALAYAVFRLTLLVIAFTTLRNLPSSAYQTVQWTAFFPYIG